MLTDIKTNDRVLSSMGQMLCFSLKSDPESGNVRVALTIREFIELIFMPKSEE
jgi:hypothetical protein